MINLPEASPVAPLAMQNNNTVQDSILVPVLRLTVIVPLTALIAAIPDFIQTRNWLMGAIYAALLVWSLIIAFVPRIPRALRINGLLVTLFALGFGELLTENPGIDPKVILAGFSVAAVLFLGNRIGIIAAVVSAATVALTSGVILVTQTSNASANYAQQVAHWLSSSLTYALISAFLIGMVAFFKHGVQKETESSHEIQRELSKQIKDLDYSLLQANRSNKRSEKAFDSADLFAQQFLAEDKPDATLYKAVQFIEDEFSYSFVGVYLIDEKNEYLQIKSAAGKAAGNLLAQNFRVRVSDQGNVSYAFNHGEMRLSSNVREDRDSTGDYLLPDTLSQLVLPITYQEKVIGVIDVQSTQINAFSPLELKILRTYTDQTVIGYQKSRLLEEWQKTQEEVNNAYRQFTQKTWQNHLKQGKRKFSLRYRQNVLEKEAPQNTETLKAINQGETIIISDQTNPIIGKPATSVAVPIRLRDQVIGVLNLKIDAAQLPRDLMPLIESISNRMAIALENARLLEEIQAKADREHLVGEISSKIRSSPNVEQVLRTAVSEIGLSMGASEVMIHLHTDQ